MYKAADNGPKHRQLQDAIRTRGISDNISVTTSPKATYRESDIIDMVARHHPDPTPHSQIEIELSDDFSAHKTDAVRDAQWSKGIFGINFFIMHWRTPRGSGVTERKVLYKLPLNNI